MTHHKGLGLGRASWYDWAALYKLLINLRLSCVRATHLIQDRAGKHADIMRLRGAHAGLPGTHGICFDSIGNLYAVQDTRSFSNGIGASLWKVDVTSGNTTAVASWPPALNPECTNPWLGWYSACTVSPDDSYVLITSSYCLVVWKVDIATKKVSMHALARWSVSSQVDPERRGGIHA